MLTEGGESGEGDRRRRVFGRRKGRPLRPARAALLAQNLPAMKIALPNAGPSARPRAGAILDPAELFPFAASETWLEIGFGAGDHLAWQAAGNPAVRFLGCEPFVEGVASLLARVARDGLRNIRILDDDARLLLDCLAPASLDRVFILFPDPWPKTRHHKRRIVTTETLDRLARAMRPGAELRLATDHADYAAWMLAHATDHPGFAWTARAAADWRTRPADWPET
ncbi:MAG: tRNA (guanosine(46)-N7)-methyltransferase TrmB, partial [Rhodospirillaceae bacterium]|nr:tRNA (guanosine(46)-N7)-methyltransferase TrmB [Rhodospirillaceae bacterium]